MPSKLRFQKPFLWIVGVYLASLLLISGAEAYPPDYGRPFEMQIQKALVGLNQSGGGRVLKLKGMNDSLEKSGRVAGMFLNWQVADPVFLLLESAERDYPENFFTLFLRALIFDLRGDSRNANRFFEEFLLKSHTYTDFEKAFIRQNDFKDLRREVESLLIGRGISLRGQENRIRDRVPMQGLESYRRHPSSWDQSLNIAFLVVIFGGGVGLLLMAFGGAEFWRPGLRSILGIYFAVWIAYGIWLLDLAIGLPYAVSRLKVIPVFLGTTAVILVVRELIEFLQEKARPLEEGMKRCPHCKAVIVRLATECFYCKGKV